MTDFSPEIDPRKLYESAPEVLWQLAKIADAVYYYAARGWNPPDGLKIAAGDSLDLIKRLMK